MYHCLKYADNLEKMSQCPQRKEDEHCFYCMFYWSDATNEEACNLTEETKRKVLESMLETLKYALGEEKYNRIINENSKD